MAAVNEQRELANEIADTIATPLYTNEIDDVCSSRVYSFSLIITCLFFFFFKDELKRELEDLEQDELNERLNQADHVPIHQPPIGERVEVGKSLVTHNSCILSGLTNLLAARTTKTAVEDDEEAQLKALQAELAM